MVPVLHRNAPRTEGAVLFNERNHYDVCMHCSCPEMDSIGAVAVNKPTDKPGGMTP